MAAVLQVHAAAGSCRCWCCCHCAGRRGGSLQELSGLGCVVRAGGAGLGAAGERGATAAGVNGSLGLLCGGVLVSCCKSRVVFEGEESCRASCSVCY
jgi:hypothetical protein